MSLSFSPWPFQIPASAGSALKPTVEPTGTVLVTGRQAVARRAVQTTAAKCRNFISVPLSTWRQLEHRFGHKRGGVPHCFEARGDGLYTPIPTQPGWK